MKYLLLLLGNLRQGHWARLKDLKLTNKEQEVYDYVMNNLLTTPQTFTEIADLLKTSEGSLRKTTSLLLDKILYQLEPNGGMDLYRTLANVYAHGLLRHEIKKEEKKLLASDNTTQLAELYYNTPELFLNGYVTVYDLDYFNDVIEKYKSLGAATAVGVAVMEIQVLKMRVILAERGTTKESEEYIRLGGEILKEIEKKSSLLEKGFDPVLAYWVDRMKGEYAEHFGKTDKPAIHYWNKLLDIYDKYREHFTIRYGLYPKLNIGLDHYDNSRQEEAFTIWNGLWEEQRENMMASIFFCDIFSQLCIALGKYELAEDVIFACYPFDREKPYATERKDYLPLASLSIIAIMKEDYDLAFQNLQSAIQKLEKSTFFILDVMLRIIENSYFFLTGDDEITVNLVTKNLKFYQYRTGGGETDLFKSFHQLTRSFLKMKYEDVKLSEEQEKFYQEWQQGEFAFLGILLTKMRASLPQHRQ